MSKNKSSFISNWSEDTKADLSFLLAPVFPIFHAMVDFPDFKKHWTEGKDKKQIVDKVSLSGALCLAWIGVTGMAVSVANDVDQLMVRKEHDEKILAAVEEMACEVPKDQFEVVCGVREIPPTAYRLPWLPFSGDVTQDNLVVVTGRRLVDIGLNRNGEGAQQVCNDVRYASVSNDLGFVRASWSLSTPFSKECIVVNNEAKPPLTLDQG